MEKYTADIPNKLQTLISETLGDEVLWKEQCQSDASLPADSLSCNNSKTRYIQMHSLREDDRTICSDSSVSVYKILNANEVPETKESSISQITSNAIGNMEPLPPSILKETTV